MTLEKSDLPTIIRLQKPLLEKRPWIFEVQNVVTPRIMGKPTLMILSLVFSATLLAVGTQAKNDEATSYQEKIEVQIQDLLDQIANVNETCELLNGFKKKVCIKKNTVTPQNKILALKNDLRDFEQAQRIEKKKEMDSELAQNNQVKQSINSQKDKTIKAQKLSIAALEALKKVKAKVQGE